MHTGGGGRAWLRRGPLAALATLLLGQTSCLILPVRFAPAVEGRVVDAVTGSPLAGALVVVRYDGRYGDVLPDREVLAHLEGRTDASGRFRIGPLTQPGIAAWPYFQTEARVTSVFYQGYRCARPQAVRDGSSIVMRLQPALDDAEQRDSCRPVPANRGEATEYMSAWRALHSDAPTAAQSETEHQIERLLEARSVLGFGENCDGPVVDLALAPGGARAAYVVRSGDAAEVHLIERRDGGWSPPRVVGRDTWPPRRLAWTARSELVLWGQAPKTQRAASMAVFGPSPIERVFTPADLEPDPEQPEAIPLDPADLNDEADTLWLGRSFAMARALDPVTGLSSDVLTVVSEDGKRAEIALPGEACGPRGRFGRPHYRIAQDGLAGLDLRYVRGGCHALQVDLQSGAWTVLDAASGAAECRQARNVPASHLSVGLRGYVRDVTGAVTAAGADPQAAYVLHIDEGGGTRVETRSLGGEPKVVTVPDFPLTTPLHRISVSVTGQEVQIPAAPAPVAPAQPQPDFEPL